MSNIDQLYDVANDLKEQGDLEGAVGKLREILSIDPNNVLCHAAIAINLQKLDQFDDAILHAQKVAELDPKDSFSFTQLSVIYQRCGRIPEAEEAKTRARAIQMGGDESQGEFSV
jgi:Flp pilus assembly protein TadD